MRRCPNCGSSNIRVFVQTRRNYYYGRNSYPRYTPNGKLVIKCFSCGFRKKVNVKGIMEMFKLILEASTVIDRELEMLGVKK